MAKKSLSHYTLKTIKRAKINNVKCYLRAYQTKSVDPVSLEKRPLIVFYYEVTASDGSYRKLTNEQDALKAFEELVAFEKRHMHFNY